MNPMTNDRMMGEQVYPENPAKWLDDLNGAVSRVVGMPGSDVMVDTKAIRAVLPTGQYQYVMYSLAVASFAAALQAGGHALAAVEIEKGGK